MKKPLTIFILFAAGTLTIVMSFTAAGRFVWWVFVLGLVLIAAGLAFWYVRNTDTSDGRQGGRQDGKYAIHAKYEAKPGLMTQAELIFYRCMCAALQGEYEIVPQAALITFVDKRTQSAYRNELFRIIDFVICERGSFRPLLAVELNDASHRRSDRRERDEKVAEILKRARLPLLFVTVSEQYDIKNLRKHLLRML